jgi:hypothetical protein
VKSEPQNYKLSQVINEDSDVCKDTDGEGLQDYYEKEIGTNPKVKDTDGDTVEGGIEIYMV